MKWDAATKGWSCEKYIQSKITTRNEQGSNFLCFEEIYKIFFRVNFLKTRTYPAIWFCPKSLAICDGAILTGLLLQTSHNIWNIKLCTSASKRLRSTASNFSRSALSFSSCTFRCCSSSTMIEVANKDSYSTI